MKEIFPIYLHQSTAWSLIEKHAKRELDEVTAYHSKNVRYEYTAKVEESGDVELSAWYSDDDGFCMSSGTCFRKIVRPFNQKQLDSIKEERMFQIATEEYSSRREAEKLREIVRIRDELFPRG